MVTERDYDREAVEAARSVLVELMRVLGEYRKDIVLVGGGVPELICPEPETAHVGTMDVDLALDHRRLTQAGYATLQQLLLQSGYKQGGQLFSFYREVKTVGGKMKVGVHFLAAEYAGTASGEQTQQIQDIRAFKARGADLAFESPVEVTVKAELPEGGTDSVTVRVASVVPFLVMKAMAMDGRRKEKDAYDICYCLRNFPGGVDAVVAAFEPHLQHGLVQDGLSRLANRFDSVTSVGPTHVANFLGVTDQEERERIRRDAFELVQHLLRELGLR